MAVSDYNCSAKLLHRLALSTKTILEIGFEVEKVLFYKRVESQAINNKKHLFISGLARSGTTTLLRYLHQSDQFASLTYSDMPFVLAPNLWKWLFGRSFKSNPKERSQMDGILVNNESPEAFDEVFWKVFLNNNYIKEERLLINEIPFETMDLFGEYVSLVIKKYQKGGKKRYLSKNNNNILRVSFLLQKFPNALFIIPFRDPLQHSLSLLNQHQHFCSIQQKDRFALKYMNWIGHYEFGLNQKPFYLGNEELSNNMMRYKKEDINFWLLSWLNYYSFILCNPSLIGDPIGNKGTSLEAHTPSSSDYHLSFDKSRGFYKRIILLQYEEFCRTPNLVMNRLFRNIDMQPYTYNLTPFEPIFRKSKNADQQILERCNLVYERMLESGFVLPS